MRDTVRLLLVGCLISCGGGGSSDGGSPIDGGGSADVVSAPSDYTCTGELHVATTGDDGNSGADLGNALKTIAAATAQAGPGDCIKVHAGTYPETTTIGFPTDGTATAPIVLWSVDGRGAAIIDAGGITGGPMVLVRQDYIVIDGFDFRNMPTDTGEQVIHYDGLGTGKCAGSVLRNSRITGGHDHIKLNQASSGITIENNEFYGTFGHIPISLTGANNMVFRFNYCHDWNTGDNGAVQIKGGSHDSVFDGNRFEDITSLAGAIALGDGCDTTCDIDPDHYAGVRLRAINNLFTRVGRGVNVQGCKDCAVLSNTFVASGSGNVILKLTSATTTGVTLTTLNARIQDNLIANPAADQGSIIQVNAGSEAGLVMDYNLAWNGTGSVNWGSGHPAGADTNSVVDMDPKLTSATDYTPAAGSPAIGAGVNLFSDVPRDANDAPRPTTGPFDIGAIQTR